MKINEKNLAAFATSSTPVDREGFLLKRGETNKGYQKRWFVLKGNLLFYFEKKTDKEPVGIVILEGCTIELTEDEENFGFKIVFHGPGNRSYYLAAESQESMEGWMKVLSCASYDFMKLMVAELQKQLDDIDECASSNNYPSAPPRQRHNPFNKKEDATPQGAAITVSLAHQRSQNMRSSYRPEDLFRQRSSTFNELHVAYGRMILDLCPIRPTTNDPDLLVAI
ncbi:sesquipedalian-1-like [Cloeon dipterum]|uniref:PH domain-containing protein n=1 Tax=Cloeon dipterum TaxID=197152 RepID=A0A8S1CN72_9INSE|nr:Hypothetical predicted protein [Cloeon dipterum]